MASALAMASNKLIGVSILAASVEFRGRSRFSETFNMDCIARQTYVLRLEGEHENMKYERSQQKVFIITHNREMSIVVRSAKFGVEILERVCMGGEIDETTRKRIYPPRTNPNDQSITNCPWHVYRISKPNQNPKVTPRVASVMNLTLLQPAMPNSKMSVTSSEQTSSDPKSANGDC